MSTSEEEASCDLGRREPKHTHIDMYAKVAMPPSSLPLVPVGAISEQLPHCHNSHRGSETVTAHGVQQQVANPDPRVSDQCKSRTVFMFS